MPDFGESAFPTAMSGQQRRWSLDEDSILQREVQAQTEGKVTQAG